MPMVMPIVNAEYNWLQDKNFIIESLVGLDGSFLFFLSDHFKRDKDVVRAAVEQNAEAINYASTELQAEIELIDIAISHGWSLRVGKWSQRQSKSIVMAVVQKDGTQLRFASDELTDDKDIVLAAIQNNVRAFYYASQALKRDPDVKRAAGR